MRNLLHHFGGLSASSIVGLPATLMIGAITLYQRTLSPDHGPLRHLWTYGYCRHSPTCSEHAKTVIRERGAAIGGLLSLRRIVTCNPFVKPDAQRIMEIAHASPGESTH